MNEDQRDTKSAVVASAAVLHEIMDLYDQHGLYAAAAYLSSALDAACADAGVDRAMLTGQFKAISDDEEFPEPNFRTAARKG